MTIRDQPPPTPNDRSAIWDLVIADMKERNAVGCERYGTPLQAFNGRDALVDAYQEALDLAVYLRQAIAERDQKTQCWKCGDSDPAFTDICQVPHCGMRKNT